MSQLTSVARYRRRIGASPGRVWENVRDWEHLPWLHGESFAGIDLEEAGDFGWRARIDLQPASAAAIRLELVIEDERRYVSRTLEGPGTGSEIWTRLSPVDARHTDIEVEFCLPDVSPGQQAALGDAYVALYTRLWDQDEAMMQRRSYLLDAWRATAPPGACETVDLGPLGALESRLPLRVHWAGRPFRLLRHEGELRAHDALCPHALGPLDEGAIEDGCVVCPWHGYAFDLRSGRGCGVASRLQLAPAPRVEVVGDRVWLLPG